MMIPPILVTATILDEELESPPMVSLKLPLAAVALVLIAGIITAFIIS